MNPSEKEVLIEIDSHTKRVCFPYGDDDFTSLTSAVQTLVQYKGLKKPFFLQMYCKDFDRYVDFVPEENLPNKSIVKVVWESKESTGKQVSTGCSSFGIIPTFPCLCANLTHIICVV